MSALQSVKIFHFSKKLTEMSQQASKVKEQRQYKLAISIFFLYNLENKWTCVSIIYLRCHFTLFRTLLFPKMHYEKDVLTQFSKKQRMKIKSAQSNQLDAVFSFLYIITLILVQHLFNDISDYILGSVTIFFFFTNALLTTQDVPINCDL